MTKAILFVLLVMLLGPHIAAQDDALVSAEEHFPVGDAGPDPAPDLLAYDRLIKAHGADSVRSCNGFPCTGWVEDHYPDGGLKHRGYYDSGQLVTFKNHHPNGSLEREFKVQGTSRSILRTYHINGSLRSETRYSKGEVTSYEDHYVNGIVRYQEERHPKRPYYTRMDLFDGQGRPISLLELVDARNEVFEQQEFHPGGVLKCQGQARFDPVRGDTQRIGIWKIHDPDGTLIREDRYIDGKIHR